MMRVVRVVLIRNIYIGMPTMTKWTKGLNYVIPIINHSTTI